MWTCALTSAVELVWEGLSGGMPCRWTGPELGCHLPLLGADERMAFTPNFRNVGSLAGERTVCGELPRRFPGPGEPMSEAPVGASCLGGDRLAVGMLRGR